MSYIFKEAADTAVVELSPGMFWGMMTLPVLVFQFGELMWFLIS